jgi:mRNA-degrading endonuclease RelE of RelBE toxin-antitoxin system
MAYDKFKKEVERILKEEARPLTWNEIKENSTQLRQKAPYHVYVQKLQGDIGLVRFKSAQGRDKKTVWALREWFEKGKFQDLLPGKARFTILSSKKDHAIAANVYWELRRIYPVPHQLNRWDVIEAEVEDFFPEEDKRPDSIRLKSDGIELLRTIEDEEERITIAEKISESGEFLHTDAWKGKTLGMTKPRFRCFYFYDSKCQFFCDQNVCVGHDMGVDEEGEAMEIKGDRVYFVLEAVEREGGEFIWEKIRVGWYIKSVISLTDPRQRRLL